MKTIRILAVCIFLLCAAVLPVVAADEYATAGDLYGVWYENLPDYITGIWSTDGSGENLTFGIKEDCDRKAAEAEILALVEDDSTVSFAVQKYSFNELRQINDEIFSCFPGQENDGHYGFVSMGIYDMENVIHVVFLEERKDDPVTVAFIEELQAKYGDAIEISFGKAITTYAFDAQLNPIDTGNKPPVLWFALFAALLMLAAGMVVFTKRKKAMAVLETSCGTKTAEEHSLTVKKVETIVRDSGMEVPPSLDRRITQEIEKQN